MKSLSKIMLLQRWLLGILFTSWHPQRKLGRYINQLILHQANGRYPVTHFLSLSGILPYSLMETIYTFTGVVRTQIPFMALSWITEIILNQLEKLLFVLIQILIFMGGKDLVTPMR